MSEPFLSEIKMVGFNFAPRGWLQCDGQILPINQYQSLYSLLGTTFGGDGRTTFGIPDLRGRSPRKGGSGVTGLGTKAGAENVTLTNNQIPHAHSLSVAASSDSLTPDGNYIGKDATAPPTLYHAATAATVAMTAGTVGSTGAASPQSHNNMQPYLAVNFCIALTGVFPSRN